MKIYGWDDSGVMRGDMLAANVTARDLDFGLDAVAGDLGWEFAFLSFKDARIAMLEQMQRDGADEELIQNMRTMKASYLPVVELE